MSSRFEPIAFRPSRAIRAALVGLACTLPSLVGMPAQAGPRGERVQAGQARFSREGHLTRIEAAHNTVINYSSFDIAAHERVLFVQPSAASRVLNRVQSLHPTMINGTLQANGMVYVVNPAGVFFGQGALVDVGGIVAGAGRISNADFLGNIGHFTDVTGSVVNHGTIQAGMVTLLGRHVANHGTIVAPGGTVSMLAGDDLLLGDRDRHLMVRLDGAGAEAVQAAAQQPGVENTGAIAAGKVVWGAGDIYSLAVRNQGTVQAREVAIDGGGGRVEIGGTIDASDASAGGAGGQVDIRGGQVIVDAATLDASGTQGGGHIGIGGQRGQGSSETHVLPGSVLRADALADGDGGTILIWSDGLSTYYGTLSATGGPLGGDGGFAEVSGAGELVFRGPADLGASSGLAGRLLLDPETLTIDSVAAAFISGTLSSGAAVDMMADKNIFVNSAVASTGSGDLTLTAGHHLFLNAPITMEGGVLTLVANGWDIVGDSTLPFHIDAPTVNLVAAGSVGIDINHKIGIKNVRDLSIDVGDNIFLINQDSRRNPTDLQSLSLRVNPQGGSGRVATPEYRLLQFSDDIFLRSDGGNLVVDLLRAGGDGTTNDSVAATTGDLLVASEFTEPSGRDHLVGIQAGDGDVSLTAEAGSIDEVRDADAVEIRTGGTVTLTAGDRVGGSGASPALDVETAALAGSSGGPFVVRDHTGDLLLGNVSTGDGEIDIETPGTLTVPDGSTISTATPNDVTLTGAAIELNNGGIQGTARQTYNGPVTLGADTTLGGTDILFNGTVQSDGMPRDLVVNSSGGGITRFGGDVGGDGNVLRRLMTNVDGTTEIGGNIDTAGRLGLNDAVILIGDDIMLVDMGTGRDAGVYFGSTVDSDGTPRGLIVQVNTADTTDAPEVPLISFAGDVGVGSPLKYLRLNTKSPRADVPAVATIVAALRKADGTIDLDTPIDFNVRVLEDLRIGPNEKLTILGDWTLDAGLGGPSVIELGDISAGGLVTLNANGSTVEFLERTTGQVLLPGDGNGNGLLDDFLNDLGVDVVVRDGFVLNDGLILNSPGGPGAPRFAALDPSTVTGSGLEDFTVLELTDGFPPLVRIGADGRIIVLDLAAPMPQAAQLATAFPDTPQFQDRIRIPLARIEHLLEMQIAVRPADSEELRRRTDGNATYNDVDTAAAARADGRVVTINRIREQVVLDALATYRNLFYREQTDTDGQLTRASRLEEWQGILAASYDRFRKAGGPDVLDATAFRAFLENTPGEQDALTLINGLRELYSKFALLGLTAPELAQAPDTIARQLGGSRIAPFLLNQAVMALPAASSSE